MAVLYTNNAASLLSASITDTATSFSVTSGHGALFPAPTGSDYFYVTLLDTAGNIEIVKVTGRSTDTFTVTRGQDGTSARAFSVGDKVELRIVRAMLDDLKGERLPLTGGTLTGPVKIQGLGVANPTTADSTDNSILSLRATNALVRLQFGTRNSGNYAGWIQASYDNTGGANGLESLELNPLGGTVYANGNTVLHAGNYTDYAAPASHTHSYLPLSGGTLTGKVITGSSDGDSIEVRNDTASAASSGYITFKNKNGIGVYRPAARISGVNIDNAYDGDFLIETYSGGVAYKGLRVDENSDVFFYDTSGNVKFQWEAVNSRALINSNVVLHAGNYSSYAAPASHTHSYLPLSGGTLSGNLNISSSGAIDNAWAANGVGAWRFIFASSTNTEGFGVGAGGFGIYLNGNSTGDYSLKFATDGTVNAPSGLKQGGNQVLHAGNYSSYAVPWSGSSQSGLWLFNNMGNNHTTYTDFNNVPGFGAYYVQGASNGPGFCNQYYGFTLGLGNDFGYSSYAMQFAIPRLPAGGGSVPYLGIRFREGGSWGSWQKASAGRADYALKLDGYDNQTEYTILDGPANGPVIKVRYDSATANRYIDIGYKDGYGTYSSALKFYNGDILTLSGNIGLGVSPDIRLSVNGEAHISSYLYMGGTAGSKNSWGSRDYTTSGNRYINANYFEVNNYGYGSSWSFAVDGSSSRYNGNVILHAGNYTDYPSRRIVSNYQEWDFAWGSHGTTPMSISLWDNYQQSGAPSGYGTLLDIYGFSGHQHDQLYFYQGNLIHRYGWYGNNNWNSWQTILTSSNYSSYALPLSGGTMSGTITMGGNYINNAGQFNLNNGFTISQGGSNYGQFSSWVHLPGYHGLYSTNNGAHFYPNDADYGAWRINGSRGGWNGLYFDTGSTLMMNSSEVGFHRSGYGWQMWWSGGTGYVHKGSPGGGTQATILDSSNYTNYAAPASHSHSWSSITSGYREDYDIGIRPPNNSWSYAGFRFATPGNDANAGYLLVRGGPDSDVYTQNGITLVADAGWLTLAQRTGTDKGVRLMTNGTTRLSVNYSGDIAFVNGNSINYNSGRMVYGDSYASDENYNTGSIGRSGVNIDDIFQRRSGFIDVWAGGGAQPFSGYTHITGFQSMHYWDGTTGYGLQVVGNHENRSSLKFRLRSSNGINPWYDVIHSGNYTSYSDGRYVLKTGDTMTGTLKINTSGSSSGSSHFIIKRNGASEPGSFGAYAGSWRSSIEVWNNDSTRMLFLNPSENDFGYAHVKSVNGGMVLDVGSNGGTRAIQIEYSGATTVNGSLKNMGALSSSAWGASSANAATRIIAPKGAAGSWDGSPVGAIKIRLPIRAYDTMWTMKVRIYNYGVNQTYEYHVGNYSYGTGAYNQSASCIASQNAPVRNVRFGNDGTFDCVWIGETDTTWSYPVVSVTDFVGGFRNGDHADWLNSWDISIVTSFGTVSGAMSPSVNLASGSQVNSDAILHAGNYSSYAVPLSGGTMSGALTINLSSGSMLKTGASSDAFGYNGSYGHYIAGNGGTYVYGNATFWDGSASRTMLHAGNVSSYAIPLTSGSFTTYAYVTFNGGFSASSNVYFSSGVYQTVNGIANTDYSNTVSPSLNSINNIASHTYAGKTHVGLNQTAAKRRAQALAGSGGTFGTTYGYLIDEIYVNSSLNAYTVMQQNSWSFISSYATGSLNRHFYVGAESIGPGSSQYDNLMSAGASSARYTIVYATTGTINTSDVNEKEQIQDLDAAERRVAVAVKGLIKKFKWKDAVAKKGDAARIHIGVIAQEVEAAFVAEGLDPERYALFCKDVWWEKMVPNENYGREDAPNEPEMILETFQSEVEGGTRKERKGIRYDQLLAFVISAI